jgi:hypothetical protein
MLKVVKKKKFSLKEEEEGETEHAFRLVFFLQINKITIVSKKNLK